MDVVPWYYYYFFGGLEPVCLNFSLQDHASMTPQPATKQSTADSLADTRGRRRVLVYLRAGELRQRSLTGQGGTNDDLVGRHDTRPHSLWGIGIMYGSLNTCSALSDLCSVLKGGRFLRVFVGRICVLPARGQVASSPTARRRALDKGLPGRAGHM